MEITEVEATPIPVAKMKKDGNTTAGIEINGVDAMEGMADGLKNTAKRAGKCKDQCRCSRKIGQRYPHLVWFAEASISQGAGQTLLKIHMKLIRE